MSLDFILVSFATAGTPPDARMLRESRQDYFFAPLSERGPIYTVDFGLWSKPTGGESHGRSFCPTKEDIKQAVERAERSDCYLLLGLTQEQLYVPPGSEDAGLTLESVRDHFQERNSPHLVDLGFDVVDQWTGLSAVGNIGYSPGELDRVQLLHLATNRFNLLETYEGAVAFSRFAAAAAEEHAPYIPLRVMARFPSRASWRSG